MSKRTNLLPGMASYEVAAERVAAEFPVANAVGEGDYHHVGALELAILVDAGLARHHRLLDFGCGSGRLATHAIPFLETGAYIGIDISLTQIAIAREVHTALTSQQHVEFRHQGDERFGGQPVDLIAAFSVFTHIEHEDSVRYLRGMLDVSHRHTLLVASLITIDLDWAGDVFEGQANLQLVDRWHHSRNVVTSREYFSWVAARAGWQVVRWIHGTEPIPGAPNDGHSPNLGQSTVILRPGATSKVKRSS